MADTFLGTSWTGALPPWLPIGWELPRGMHRSLPMEKQRQRPPALSQRHKVAIVLSLKKRGMEQECRKKPITLFPLLCFFFFCLFLSFSLHISFSPSTPLSIIPPSPLPFSLYSLMQFLFPCLLHFFFLNQAEEKAEAAIQGKWIFPKIPHPTCL